MPRVVTQSDIDAVAPGGTLALEADAILTTMAGERAASRGVKVVRGGAAGGSGDDGGRDLVRSVTRAVVARVGHAGPQVVEAVVQEVLASLDGAGASLSSPVARGGVIPASSIVTPRGSTIVGQPAGSEGGAPLLDVCMACIDQEKKRTRNRAVLTTTGRNTKGIVARVTARIAEMGGDILDISQTLIGEYFTMIIVIDVAALSVSFERFQEAVQKAVAEMGCQAMVMHDDVMTSLHRV